MAILTLEGKFGAQLVRAVEKRPPPYETEALLRENHHLWPFYLYPGESSFVAPIGQDESQTVPVRVYRGNWITDCPFCSSAQHASPEDQWFFCASCKNTSVGNRSLPVAWPENREQIEQILLARPFMESRNWFPYETVEELQAENALHLGSGE